MAVRFDADNQDYWRQVAWGATTQWSITCWAKISVDRNAFSTLWCLDQGDANDLYVMQTSANGTTLSLYDEALGSGVAPLAMTVGTWYYVGVAVNGAAGAVVTRPASTATFTTTTWASGRSPSTNIQYLDVGESVWNGEWWNGCVAACKVWRGAALTTAELEAESITFMPRRWANLALWFPWDNPSQIDFSGNDSVGLSGGGTSPELRSGVGDNPPISWGDMGAANELWVMPPSGGGVTPFSGWGVPV